MNEKILWTINIALVLGVIFFSLHLLDVELPSLGKAQYWLDDSEPVCITDFEGKTTLIDMGQCCYGLQMQLKCEDWRKTLLVDGEEKVVEKKCYTGESTVGYLVNLKAFNQCKFG